MNHKITICIEGGREGGREEGGREMQCQTDLAQQ